MSPPNLEVESSRSAPSGWNGFVEGHPAATFCHLAEWGAILEEAFGLEPIYWVATSSRGIEGVLPAVRMPTIPWGTVVVSMPYLNYGGPVGTPAARSALLERALSDVRAGTDRSMELRCRAVPGSTPGDTDDAAVTLAESLGPGREKITVVMDLPGQSSTLFEDEFGSKLRAQIRRPMKEEMEVHFGPDRLDEFYDVFAATMRDLGTPVLPLGLFQAIRKHLSDRMLCGVVHHEGRPVAGGVGFRWRNEFEMTWAASLWSVKRLAPNMLLYWSFMEHCIGEGLSVFNFGRCTPGSGTHRFKRQWGTRDEPLPWLQWPPEAEAQTGDSGPFRTATAVWRKLPLPVANLLGPRLARRLPTF